MKQGRKGMIRKIITAAASVILALVMVAELPAVAKADLHYLENGNIRVETDAEGNYTVKQGTNETHDTDPVVISNQNPENMTSYVLTINSGSTGDNAAHVTLENVNIFFSQGAAVRTTGDVVLEINGTNILQAPQTAAALVKNDDGILTIQDANGDGGSLDATGGVYAAGIGGSDSMAGNNIIITGGNITARGGNFAAGIGGGNGGSGSNITISGGNVTAIGGERAAGIGGGWHGAGNNITISDGNVTANGGTGAVGIGGGRDATGTNNHITGGTVTVDGEIVEPEIPVPVQPAQQAIPVAEETGVSGGNAQSTPAGDFGAFTEQLNAQIESYIQQLQALIASGSADVLQAVMQAGFTLNLGNHTMLDARTCVLLGQVLDMGVPVRIDFTHGGVGYRTTIPTDRKGSLTVLASDGLCTIEELTAAFETKVL